jgi:hypothetical protein
MVMTAHQSKVENSGIFYPMPTAQSFTLP